MKHRVAAITEFPITSKENELSFANITLINLHTGEYRVVDRSLAWASQLGAQVQFAGKNNHLLLGISFHSMSHDK